MCALVFFINKVIYGKDDKLDDNLEDHQDYNFDDYQDDINSIQDNYLLGNRFAHLSVNQDDNLSSNYYDSYEPDLKELLKDIEYTLIGDNNIEFYIKFSKLINNLVKIYLNSIDNESQQLSHFEELIDFTKNLKIITNISYLSGTADVKTISKCHNILVNKMKNTTELNNLKKQKDLNDEEQRKKDILETRKNEFNNIVIVEYQLTNVKINTYLLHISEKISNDKIIDIYIQELINDDEFKNFLKIYNNNKFDITDKYIRGILSMSFLLLKLITTENKSLILCTSLIEIQLIKIILKYLKTPKKFTSDIDYYDKVDIMLLNYMETQSIRGIEFKQLQNIFIFNSLEKTDYKNILQVIGRVGRLSDIVMNYNIYLLSTDYINRNTINANTNYIYNKFIDLRNKLILNGYNVSTLHPFDDIKKNYIDDIRLKILSFDQYNIKTLSSYDIILDKLKEYEINEYKLEGTEIIQKNLRDYNKFIQYFYNCNIYNNSDIYKLCTTEINILDDIENIIEKLLNNIKNNIPLNIEQQFQLYLTFYLFYHKDNLRYKYYNITQFYDEIKGNTIKTLINKWFKLIFNENNVSIEYIKDIDLIEVDTTYNTIDRPEISVPFEPTKLSDKQHFITDNKTTKDKYIIPITYRVINLNMITTYNICHEFIKTGYCMINNCQLIHSEELSLKNCLEFLKKINIDDIIKDFSIIFDDLYKKEPNNYFSNLYDKLEKKDIGWYELNKNKENIYNAISIYHLNNLNSIL